jgi:hypothetical protein
MWPFCPKKCLPSTLLQECFGEKLVWHRIHHHTTTTKPIHPNPAKKHICKKTMSPLLTRVVLPNFLGCMALHHHVRGARAFFSHIIIQFLRYQHRNWYITQPHNRPGTSNHGAIFPIQWLWQPGCNNQRHSPNNESYISHPEEEWRGGKNWQLKRKGQSKMGSCVSQVYIIHSDRPCGFDNNYIDVVALQLSTCDDAGGVVATMTTTAYDDNNVSNFPSCNCCPCVGRGWELSRTQRDGIVSGGGKPGGDRKEREWTKDASGTVAMMTMTAYGDDDASNFCSSECCCCSGRVVRCCQDHAAMALS